MGLNSVNSAGNSQSTAGAAASYQTQIEQNNQAIKGEQDHLNQLSAEDGQKWPKFIDWLQLMPAKNNSAQMSKSQSSIDSLQDKNDKLYEQQDQLATIEQGTKRDMNFRQIA